jgi:hypothetical protein
MTKVDFELALQHSLMKSFPESRILGCLFHFIKANKSWIAKNADDSSQIKCINEFSESLVDPEPAILGELLLLLIIVYSTNYFIIIINKIGYWNPPPLKNISKKFGWKDIHHQCGVFITYLRTELRSFGVTTTSKPNLRS